MTNNFDLLKVSMQTIIKKFFIQAGYKNDKFIIKWTETNNKEVLKATKTNLKMN